MSTPRYRVAALPHLRLCVAENNDGFHFASFDAPDVALCPHTFSRAGDIAQWIQKREMPVGLLPCPRCARRERLVVITVPHENCDIPGPHTCDRAAMPMARALATALGERGARVILLPNRERALSRVVYDENRPALVDSAMRAEIRETYENNKGCISFVIDAHSFDPDHKEHAFYILNTEWITADEEDNARLVHAFSQKTDTPDYLGSRDKNWIATYFRRRNVPAFILETNERLSLSEMTAAAVKMASAAEDVFWKPCEQG